METFLKETKGSVTNLISKKLQDLESAKVQRTPWIRFKIDVEDRDGDVVRVDMVKKAFNSGMMEVFQGSELGKIIKEMFAHMKTQVEHPVVLGSCSTESYSWISISIS